MGFTVDGCIDALVDLGYEFILREDGTVVVNQPAKRNPRAAEMMSYLALHKEAVRVAVRERGQRSFLPTVNPAVEAQQPGNAIDDEPEPEDQRVINETLDKPEGFDQIRASDGSIALDGSGEVHALVGMNWDEASSLIEFIHEGKGELIGLFVYHKSTGLFDASVRFLEGWAD